VIWSRLDPSLVTWDDAAALQTAFPHASTWWQAMSDEVGNVNDAMHVDDDVEVTPQQEDKDEGERDKQSRRVSIRISRSECAM
jgi:hypothetical protein